MKNLIYVFGVFIGLTNTVIAQELPALKVGDQLNYLVDRGTDSYNFDITLTEVTNGIAFNWVMSNPINKSGSITISANALKSATTYYNYFKAEDKVLEDQSCIFLSDANFKDLVSTNKTTIDMGGDGTGNGVYSGAMDEMMVTYKKSTGYQKAYFLKLENSTKELVVLPIGNHHIIAKMNLHFAVSLISIK